MQVVVYCPIFRQSSEVLALLKIEFGKPAAWISAVVASNVVRIPPSREIILTNDANRRGYRRKELNHVVEKCMVFPFKGGLVPSHAKAFSAGEGKTCGDWVMV